MLFPLVVAYACYLLMYHEQKSWYSFCLSTIYGFLLTFGKHSFLLKQYKDNEKNCID